MTGNLSCPGGQKRLLCWRRRRDSNPRDAFDAYAISSRAPSTKLGDSSLFDWIGRRCVVEAQRLSRPNKRYYTTAGRDWQEYILLRCKADRRGNEKGNRFRSSPMRPTRLELVPIAGHAPQTCAYADSAMAARNGSYYTGTGAFCQGYFPGAAPETEKLTRQIH